MTTQDRKTSKKKSIAVPGKGASVRFTDAYLRSSGERFNRFNGRVGLVTGIRMGAVGPVVVFPKEGRRIERKLVDVDPSNLEVVSAPVASRPTLSASCETALRSLVRQPTPRQEFNPGVAGRLLRDGQVASVQLPSPYATHKGRSIEFFQITQAGRDALLAA